jgi:ribonuclease P protein component
VTLIVIARPELNGNGQSSDEHSEQGSRDYASRFAFVAGRHIGSAVRRNRVKRRLREIVRLRLADVEAGWDCMLIARPAAAEASFAELERAVVQLFAKAGVMAGR